MTTRASNNSEPRNFEQAMALVDQLQVDVAERDARISEHHARISERDAIIVECNTQIAELLNQLKKRFARSSERLDALSAAQLLLFNAEITAEEAKSEAGESADAIPAANDAKKDEPKDADGSSNDANDSTVEVKSHRRKRNGRALIPDHLHRERVVHELSAEERACPCCGEDRLDIGCETTEVLEFVPATLKAVVHERRKYSCPECPGNISIAEVPKAPFDRSKAGPGLLAMVLVSKYADHIPLYRQEGIFKRFGVIIPRSTQSDWMRQVAETLEPLSKRLAKLIRKSRIIQSDDTPVKLRDGPTKGMSEARFWSYIGDREHPYVAFDFSRNRRGEHPQGWLGPCSGFLQTDAYAGYKKLFEKEGGLVPVGCWAHARRKFFDARLSHPARALEILELIKKLYAVEREARPDDPSVAFDGEARHVLRNVRSRELLDLIFETLLKWEPEETPKSPLGKAIRYALNLQAELRRYLEDGEIEIDNNGCERSIRGIALGRKNWLFAGSERGGATAATIFTVIGSARLHEVEPWAYLHDILNRMPHVPMSQLDDFLPDRWLKNHPDARLPLDRGTAK